jgi:hypothetical protein
MRHPGSAEPGSAGGGVGQLGGGVSALWTLGIAQRERFPLARELLDARARRGAESPVTRGDAVMELSECCVESRTGGGVIAQRAGMSGS